MALTAAIARTRDRTATIPLIRLSTRDTGAGITINISDRVVTVGANTYEDHLVSRSGVEEHLNRVTSESKNSDFTMTLKNGPCVVGGTEYATLLAAHEAHPFDGGVITFACVFTEDGEFSEETVVFVGVAEEPTDITAETLTVRCSSKVADQAANFELEVFEEGEWPYLAADDYGMVAPELIGEFKKSPCPRKRWGEMTTVREYLNTTATTIKVSDTTEFPSSGTIMIDYEKIDYTGKSGGNTFTGCTRHVGGSPTQSHLASAPVIGYRDEYHAMVANHHVESISKVWGQFGDVLVALEGYTLTNGTRGSGDPVSFISFSPVPLLDGVTDPGGTLTYRYSLMERMFVDGEGLKSDNSFFGTVGNHFDRPDRVMKAWIVKKLGFAQADIDTTSFDAAGSWYASNGYTTHVRIYDLEDPMAVLAKIAFECRSLVWFARGKWYLMVIPDTAPSATKTISRSDLAGRQSDFTCGYTPREGVRNVIRVKYNRTWGPNAHRVYRGARKVTNVLTNYRRCPDVIKLDFVTSGSQAEGVAGIYLKQRQRIYSTVEFPVFWDSTDVSVGDTIAISGQGWWEGKKFFIQDAARDGVETAVYRGVEWW